MEPAVVPSFVIKYNYIPLKFMRGTLGDFLLTNALVGRETATFQAAHKNIYCRVLNFSFALA